MSKLNNIDELECKNAPITDTGNPEADRIISRLMSDDPDFDDCIEASVFIRRLVCEHRGPDGFPTWKDAAIAERLKHAAPVAQPDADANAPWLTMAHNLCTDAGIKHGHITQRLEDLGTYLCSLQEAAALAKYRGEK